VSLRPALPFQERLDSKPVVTRKLVERATMDSELVPSYVDLVFVARALERIGDHATSIAEDSFWRDQATDIRHTYGPKKED
jgi:phosphate transport system protein